MAAAVAWVLRDGVGMFGSLIFSYLVGASFDVRQLASIRRPLGCNALFACPALPHLL